MFDMETLSLVFEVYYLYYFSKLSKKKKKRGVSKHLSDNVKVPNIMH